METVKSLVSVFLAAILTENYILCKFLGICPFLGVSKKLNTAVGMSAAVTFVMVLATAVTWPIYYGILVPNGLAYLQTVVYILIIAALVQLIEIFLKKFIPKAEETASYGYGHAVVNALGSGLGFMLAMVLFAGVRSRVETCDCPRALRGLPITLIAASLVAVSFLGFQGVVDGLFA